MKLLLENWREYLKEEEQKVVTFDFDDTLSLSHYDPDLDYGWVYDGPHKPFIEKLFKHLSEGHTVYIVTSRHGDRELDSLENPDQRAVQEFLDEHGIKVSGVFFTDGKLKVQKLLELGSSLHHDDDPEEIAAAEEAGIETVISDPYGDYESLKGTLE